MPVVQIKDSDQKIKFPDQMSQDQMLNALKRQYPMQASQKIDDALSKPESTISNRDVSLAENTKQKIANFLFDNKIVSDRYGAQRIGDNLSSLLGVLPGIGDAQAGDEFGKAVAEGDYANAAIQGLSVIPAIGDFTPAIFAGVMAKNADKLKLKKAQELQSSGADRDKIWKETGWLNDKGDWKFEISDDKVGFLPTGREETFAADLNQVIKHDDLYSQYPDTEEIQTLGGFGSGKGASYNPADDEIKINFPDDRKSTLLHEVQHAVQQREGFARGGTPESASYFLKQNKDKALSGLGGKRYAAESALFDMGKYGSAQYLAKLDALSKSDSVKPSSVLNLSDFYQYSTEIRDRFGSMPKTNAKGRNEWLRSAAAFIKNKNMDDLDYTSKQLVQDAIREPKLTTSEYNKAKRRFGKVEGDYKEYAQVKRKFESIEKMSSFDKYQRLSGEAEARLVEKRINMTPQERLDNPPWYDLDVPEDELIYRPSQVKK
jgi:hypothetical protein